MGDKTNNQYLLSCDVKKVSVSSISVATPWPGFDSNESKLCARQFELWV
jgi:hypothetical protein